LDYLKHGDFKSIIDSVKYIVNKSWHGNGKVIQTSIGTFFCRKNTNDFQFTNLYYEWGVKKIIFYRKNGFSAFIDTGACIVDYCILIAKLAICCFTFELVADNEKS
jgi:hypothetical protein